MKQEKEPNRRVRIVGAIGAGVLALGVVGASAASLGGITSDSLGADVGTISSCDTDGVALSPFTNSYNSTLKKHQTMSVTVSRINAACAGKSIEVVLRDAAGTALGTGTATIASGSQVVSFTAPGLDAKTIEGTSIVITG